MSSKSLWLSVVIGALCLVLCSSAASAQKRIVVLKIEGSRSDALRDSITRLIRPNKSLNDSTYRNAARRLRAPKLNPKSVVKVARYLEADGVLDGILVAKDGEYKFTVRLRSGRDGTIVSTIPMTLSKPRLSDKMQRGLRSRLIDAIDELPPLAGTAAPEEGGFDDESGFDDEGEFEDEDGDDAEEGGNDDGFDGEDEESEEGFGGDEDDDDGDRNEDEGDGDGGDDDDDDDDDDDGDDDDDDDDDDSGDDDDGDDDGDDDDDFVDSVETGSEWQDPRMRQAIVMAGLSLTKRTLTFSFAQELENPPPGYASGNVPGAYVNAILYPLMKKGRGSAIDNIGITAMYDRVLQIETNVQDDAGEVTAVPTSAERYALGAAYRMNFGKGHTKPSVTVLAAYNRNSFVIDKAMSPVAIDVPNTEYTWVDPGVRFRMGVSRQAAVHAEAHFLLVLDTGEMQELEQYGAAKVTGVDADVGVEYWLTPRYLLRAGARYTALGYDYQGNGALTDRNGDNEVDVGGALDAYLGGYVTVGAGF